MYLVCENILSIRNGASGLPEFSLRALVTDAMENSPASDALPPHPWKRDSHRFRGASIFMSRTPLSCIPGAASPSSTLKIASKDLLSQCSLEWVASLLPHVWQALVCVALLFCTKESFDYP
jgi:hypothetical protein